MFTQQNKKEKGRYYNILNRNQYITGMLKCKLHAVHQLRHAEELKLFGNLLIIKEIQNIINYVFSYFCLKKAYF